MMSLVVTERPDEGKLAKRWWKLSTLRKIKKLKPLLEKLAM